IEVALDTQAMIGESPTWCAAQSALYWIDVKQPALYRHDLAGGAGRSWLLPSDIGAFALDADLGGAVVALRTGLFHLDFASGALALLVPAPFDPALHRFNEGACDPGGRFWMGVMFDPLVPGACAPVAGSLHSFTWDGGLRAEPDAAELHNGMAWSADGRRFFVSHSQAGVVWSFAVSDEGGISDRRTFATIPKVSGIPDGAAIDTDGGYWCALHGGGRLRRYTGDGKVDRDIMLPVSQPTMCAFAGAELDVMYVTSAAHGLSAEQRRREPHAGALLRLRPGERGVARRYTIRA
ncbi:MAG: SMP-30/gluconolactonase/LRE family protein, partial [Janthinobacterium lividum]